MRLGIFVLLALATTAAAFVPTPCFHSPSLGSALAMAVELTPEPEGGEELTAVSTVPDTRMKNMGEAEGVKSDEGTVYKFWLTTVAEGQLIKEIRTTVLKDASKNANFPGFRKGQIPPYAQPQMTGFAVQEALIRSTENCVKAYGLKALPGSDGEVTVQEEVKEMCKGYKVGDSLKYTATFNAIFDPDRKPTGESTAEEEEAVPE